MHMNYKNRKYMKEEYVRIQKFMKFDYIHSNAI